MESGKEKDDKHTQAFNDAKIAIKNLIQDIKQNFKVNVCLDVENIVMYIDVDKWN